MRKIWCAVVLLSGLVSSGCVDGSGMSLHSSQPLQVSAVEAQTRHTQPGSTMPNDDPLPADDAADFRDPVPGYLATASWRQASLDRAPTAAAAASRFQARVDPATTGVVALASTDGTAAMSPEEQVRIGNQKHEEAIRAMEARIAAREREAQRTLSGICTGC